jgi:hypothetical protein
VPDNAVFDLPGTAKGKSVGVRIVSWILAILATLAAGQVSPTMSPVATVKAVQTDEPSSVTYVTRTGTPLTADEMRSRLKVGAAVHIQYAGRGRNRHIERVILDED